MIITTTSGVEGRAVKAYLGIVTGEAVLSLGMDDLVKTLQTLGNRRSPLSEKILSEATQIAIGTAGDRARELGANAVVGVHFDYETVGNGMMVIAAGTAVVLA